MNSNLNHNHTRRKRRRTDISLAKKIKGTFDEYHNQILHTIDEQMKEISMAPQVDAVETYNEVF